MEHQLAKLAVGDSAEYLTREHFSAQQNVHCLKKRWAR